MTKEEFKVLVKAMKAVYAQATFIPDNDAFNVWYELLKDLEYKKCATAIQVYMSTEKFPPTISDIREKYFDKEPEFTEMEAWALVRKAIGDSIYHSVERFNELPINIQKAIGTPNQLRNWAMDSGFNDNVVQSNFIRAYQNVSARDKTFNKLPASVQTLLTGTMQK